MQSAGCWARQKDKRRSNDMRLLRLFRRREQDAELAQELDAHLRHEIDDYVAQGLSPQEATRRAHLKLGSTTRVREDVWKWNSIRPLEGFLRDLSHAARTLSRTPAFAIMAILVMALGIGANTALFTVVHSVLLKPLPFADPDHLVMLYERAVDGKYPWNVIAPGVYAEWQKHAQSFERMAIFGEGSYNLSGRFLQVAGEDRVNPGFGRILPDARCGARVWTGLRFVGRSSAG